MPWRRFQHFFKHKQIIDPSLRLQLHLDLRIPVQDISLSEVCARHKDEQDTQSDGKGQEHDCCHCSSGHEQLPDEGLSDA